MEKAVLNCSNCIRSQISKNMGNNLYLKICFVRGPVVVGVGLALVCTPLVGIVSSLVGTEVVCRGSALGTPLGSIVSALVVTAVVGIVSVLVETAVVGILSTLVVTGVVRISCKVDQSCKMTHRYYFETNGIIQIYHISIISLILISKIVNLPFGDSVVLSEKQP